MNAESTSSEPDGCTTRKPKPRGWTSMRPVTVREGAGVSMGRAHATWGSASGDEPVAFAAPFPGEEGADLRGSVLLLALHPRHLLVRGQHPALPRGTPGLEPGLRGGGWRRRLGQLLRGSPGAASMSRGEHAGEGALLVHVLQPHPP